MKKFFMIIMLSIAFGMNAMAGGENTDEVSKMEAYDININMNSLVRYLNLTEDQISSVDGINKAFAEGMRYASQLEGDRCERMTNNSISYYIKNLKYILTDEQYKKYLMVLQVSFNNRGIKYDIAQPCE